MFNHIMLDLETLGPAPDAVIVSIGAVRMDLEKLELYPYDFYQVVDIEDAEARGLNINASTVKWWFRQEEAARSVLTSTQNKPLDSALCDFTCWATQNVATRDLHIWGKGSAYDNVILRNAYKAAGLEAPWTYRGDLCFRTMLHMFDGPGVRVEGGTKHNALDDARNQAETLINILRKVRSAQAGVRVGV